MEYNIVDGMENVTTIATTLLLGGSNDTTASTTTTTATEALKNSTAPQWMIDFVEFRRRLFLRTVEPVIVQLLGPVVEEHHSTTNESFVSGDGEFWLPDDVANHSGDYYQTFMLGNASVLSNSHGRWVPIDGIPGHHRRLSFLPGYVEDVSRVKETSMSFATLMMLFVLMGSIFLIFLSCFYHNQKTSPLFISPRRHRLPKLVPPPLPVDGYFDWVKVCFLLSDEEIIRRIGFDALIFLRFHRLALRCIVKMSVFSFIVLLPLNYTGGGHSKAEDVKGYVASLFFTDFLRFTMANVSGGSPRLWVHCFAAYLLTAIVVRELLVEYETFNSIRHCYLLSREPHLRTVLVTNIPRHLRSPSKISTYFKHVYPQAVNSVYMCQNLIHLEKLVIRRTALLARIEKQLLLLCRQEKRKLFDQSPWSTMMQRLKVVTKLEDIGVIDGSQERFAKLYTKLEDLNSQIEQEQRRRKRVMKKLDRMEAGDGRKDIDYILASPFVATDDPKQRRLLGLQDQSRGERDRQTDYQDYEMGTGIGSNNIYHPPGAGLPTQTTIPEQGPAPPQVETVFTEDEQGSYIPGGISDNPLRSRSPHPTDQQIQQQQQPPHQQQKGQQRTVSFDEEQQKTTAKNLSRGKPFVKAKSAIRRYSRLAREVSFFGRPIRSAVAVDSEGHIEDHINEVTDKAFVVMRTFTAATIAIQSMHSSKPGSMQVATAPEPRDILWENIYVSKGAVRTRSYMGEVLVLLIITFYVVPVALVSLLVSESALVSSSPRLAQLDQATALFSSAIAMVQPLCIVALQQLLPPLFMSIGRLEGLVSFSDVQMRAFSRYFLFQVLNVFLVTTVAGSIFDTIAIIVETPEAAFEMLGNSLPRMSSFFITFVTIKTFFGLGLELVRTMSLLQAALRVIIIPNPTLRTQRSVIAGMRAIDDPGWFPFHKILAQDMLVVVISVVFAVVAPLVLFPCALFCLFSRIMWTHHHLYVYESCFESGGQFWPKIFRRFVFGLIIAQMTITGQFILKEARHEAYATIALMFFTYLFLRSTRARYDPTSSTLPLEVATVMDISLSQEEEAKRNAQQDIGKHLSAPIPTARSYDMDHRTQTTGSLPDTGIVDMDSDLGSRIGGYDPFQQAYIQPSLRANPRAKPEQPFPPAQLGREEVFYSSNNNSNASSDDLMLDSGATVRLKSLNQQDRRLVNRWWNDQLQRCGKQRFLSILIGEECGTLTIGNRANLVESNNARVEGHAFV